MLGPVGISPGTNIVQVWHIQQIQGVSIQGLIELIGMGAEGYKDAPVKLPIIRKNGFRSGY